MHNDPLNVDVVVHVAHKYLADGPESKGYHCILRDDAQACPGRIVLTNNLLCAEITAPHTHLARTVPKIVEPDRSAQVIVEGPNYELMYAMTGRNCILMHQGHVFRVYKLLEPLQTSRWRCLHAETGCKAFLTVPLTLTKPATMDDHPHDHSRVKHEPTPHQVVVKEEPVDESFVSAAMESPRLRPRNASRRGTMAMEDVKPLLLSNPSTSDDQSLAILQDIRAAVSQSLAVIKPDPDAMTTFQNGHLYVRQFEELHGTLDVPEWSCAFRWTLNCNTRLSDLAVHEHERFAAVRTNDRFNMLKSLITRGFIAQRGVMTRLPDRQKVSEYELLPSNGNLSLIIDDNRFYFYKAKNNGDWLWRCVRYRWQGCKTGVAVSHCFGKFYYQPYGTVEHVHNS
uniref:FLYWCH-type domain-containing protein n=1 Tax=Anopheles dirus TaxID=7168 RepID=A0A182NG49_9DIPT